MNMNNDDDDSVFEISEEEWQEVKARRLAELGLTAEEIQERHRLGNMDHKQTKWWFTFGDNNK